MDSGLAQEFVQLHLKMPYLLVPAIAALAWLKHKGLRNPLLFAVSLGNCGLFLLWACLNFALFWGQASNLASGGYLWLAQMILCVLVPMFFVLISFVIFAASFVATWGENLFFILGNGSVLLLWMANVTAVN